MNILKANKLKNYLMIMAGGAATFLGMYLFYKYYYKKQISEKKRKLKLLTLTQTEANERASRISDVVYNLFLQFNPDIDSKLGNKFEGAVKIDFNLADNNKGVFLDFAGHVNKIEINGQHVGTAQEGERLYLKKEYLLKNNNTVTILFQNFYSHTSKGLCYFHDKSDFKSYVYGNFEPCFTHMVFPCFNQPSIKAKIIFSASTMEFWEVFSSGKLIKTCKTKDEIRDEVNRLSSEGLKIQEINPNYILHTFEQTTIIPVHLLGIAAGNFEKVYSEGNVNILMRSSVKSSSEKDYVMIAKTVINAHDWMKSNLSSPLNLVNINICFVPKIDSNSIPSANCFIIDDDFLVELNHNMYQKILLNLHLVSLTSQIWFGIDITPEWWDDIWLSKSFACFFAFHILTQLAESNEKDFGVFKEAWLLFAKKKSLAIEDDNYHKTHALKSDVFILSDSLRLLDNVTFFKGTNVILNFYNQIGSELFLKGLRNLLKQHSGKNIKYDDFKEVFNNLSQERDIKNNPTGYIEPFIIKNGINELSCNYIVEKGKIISCEVTQKSTNLNSTFYNYKTNVLIINEDGSEESIYNVEIGNNESFTIKQLLKKKKPAVILLNSEDVSYFRQIFNIQEIEFLEKNTHKIISPLNRVVICRELYEMVRACQLKPKIYINFCLNMIKNENDLLVLEYLLPSLLNTITNFVNFNVQNPFKIDFLKLIQENYYTKLNRIKNTTLLVILQLLEYNDEESMKNVLELLQKLKIGKTLSLMKSSSEIIQPEQDFANFDLEGVNITTKKQLVQRIFETDFFNIKEKNKLLNSILGENISDKYFTYTLEAAQPDKNKKKSIWNELLYGTSDDKSKINEAYMKGFAPKSQYAFMKQFFNETFFNDYLEIKNNHSTEFALKLLKYINPSFLIEEEILVKFDNLKNSLEKSDYQFIDELDKILNELFTKIKVSKIDDKN